MAANDQVWAEAARRYRLSGEHVRMARELGMNPKKLGGLANHKQEPWKLPLPQFIEELYATRFRKGVAKVTRPVVQVPEEPRKKPAVAPAASDAGDELPF
jgi:hypothetical protein